MTRSLIALPMPPCTCVMIGRRPGIVSVQVNDGAIRSTAAGAGE